MKKIKNIVVVFFLLICAVGYSQRPIHELIIQRIDSGNPESLRIIDRFVLFTGDSLSMIRQLNDLVSDLRQSGFMSASIDSVRFGSTSAIAFLFTGKKFIIQRLEFNSNDILPGLNQELNQKKKKNITYTMNDVNDIKRQIITDYENKGYPFARIATDSIVFNDSIINLMLSVDKGKYIEIDSIYIKGDVRIKPYFIYRYIDIKSGDQFSQNKINQIESRIKNLLFLDQLKPTELEFRDGFADVYVYLAKKRANQFIGMIGFLPASDKNDELVITGDLSLGLVNSFGRGEELGFRWEKLESSTQRLDVDFQFPYIFKSPFGLDMNFNLFKQDSTFLNIDYTTGVRWYASPNNYVKAYYRYKSSSVIGEIVTSSNLADIRSSVFGASFNYKALDYYINPRKGIELAVFAGAGTKEVNKYLAPNDTITIDNKDNFTQLEAGLVFDVFIPVYNNFVFHFGHVTRYDGQFNEDGNQTTFFENEMNRFGGARSLRGFDENAFSASIYSLQNVELRYLFEQNSAFYIFWNGAYYYKPLPEKTTEDFPWGVGIGLNFDTRAGIFSLSYALGKQFDNPLEIRTAKIHFGYISRF